MKITHALVSSDANPFYLDFWPVVSRVWMTRFGIRPVLCYVAKAGDQEPSHEFGDVVRLRPLADIPLHLQAQWARFFQARKFQDETSLFPTST